MSPKPLKPDSSDTEEGEGDDEADRKTNDAPPTAKPKRRRVRDHFPMLPSSRRTNHFIHNRESRTGMILTTILSTIPILPSTNGPPLRKRNRRGSTSRRVTCSSFGISSSFLSSPLCLPTLFQNTSEGYEEQTTPLRDLQVGLKLRLGAPTTFRGQRSRAQSNEGRRIERRTYRTPVG
jgi:hypothetical protein